MSHQQEVQIARSLMESEGSDVEFLSIHEAIGDLIHEGVLDVTDEEIDNMAERIRVMIDNAGVTYTFPDDGS